MTSTTGTTPMSSQSPGTADPSDVIREAARRIAARGECALRHARDPVNLPLVNNWVEAFDDANPVYTSEEHAAKSVHGGLVSPPAMIQVWTMPGLRGARGADDPMSAIMQVLDEAGFTSIVATNSDQTYHRYLRHGERVAVTTSLDEVVGPKKTALGDGWFVTTRNIWYVGAEPVAEMTFRVLKFRPGQNDAGSAQRSEEPAVDVGEPIRPAINQDTAYFWEGTASGELRIHRCGGCGLLRHPPGPMCPECGATKPTYLVSEGRGDVYSYIVHHRPPVPGKQLPMVVALVELDEGVRMLGELTGIAPEEVHIGLRVDVAFQRIDDQLVLPYWQPSAEGQV